MYWSGKAENGYIEKSWFISLNKFDFEASASGNMCSTEEYWKLWHSGDIRSGYQIWDL